MSDKWKLGAELETYRANGAKGFEDLARVALHYEARIDEMAAGLRYLYEACARIIDERELRVIAARKAALEEARIAVASAANDGCCCEWAIENLLEPYQEINDE